jgi:hypothetical protein
MEMVVVGAKNKSKVSHFVWNVIFFHSFMNECHLRKLEVSKVDGQVVVWVQPEEVEEEGCVV